MRLTWHVNNESEWNLNIFKDKFTSTCMKALRNISEERNFWTGKTKCAEILCLYFSVSALEVKLAKFNTVCMLQCLERTCSPSDRHTLSQWRNDYYMQIYKSKAYTWHTDGFFIVFWVVHSLTTVWLEYHVLSSTFWGITKCYKADHHNNVIHLLWMLRN